MLYDALVVSHQHDCILFKFMLNKNNIFSTTNLFNKVKMMNIKHLYDYKVLIYYFRYRQTICELPNHPYITCSKGEHMKPRMTKSIGQRSYFFVAPKQ